MIRRRREGEVSAGCRAFDPIRSVRLLGDICGLPRWGPIDLGYITKHHSHIIHDVGSCVFTQSEISNPLFSRVLAEGREVEIITSERCAQIMRWLWWRWWSGNPIQSIVPHKGARVATHAAQFRRMSRRQANHWSSSLSPPPSYSHHASHWDIVSISPWYSRYRHRPIHDGNPHCSSSSSSSSSGPSSCCTSRSCGSGSSSSSSPRCGCRW